MIYGAQISLTARRNQPIQQPRYPEIHCHSTKPTPRGRHCHRQTEVEVKRLYKGLGFTDVLRTE